MPGDIRIVDLQYIHGFNSSDDVNASEAQRWRTNPKTSGPPFGLGDSWANIYLWIAQAIDVRNHGDEAFVKGHHYPGMRPVSAPT